MSCEDTAVGGERERKREKEREEEEKKNAKRAAEFRAAASSSVTVAARILLDIPRAVRMRSSECRARKPRRMAPRVWVVRKGQGPRGCRATSRAVRRGIRRNEQEERDGERMRRCMHVCGCVRVYEKERGMVVLWKIYPLLPQLCRQIAFALF